MRIWAIKIEWSTHNVLYSLQLNAFMRRLPFGDHSRKDSA
jgi:hypothetical protein